MALPLVSVIIPTFRRPERVCEAVRSALAQTYTRIEVLVVSDGPEPATRAALAAAFPGDPRLRHVELQRQSGPAAARNAGVRHSQGPWLTFLDDDDLMLPDKVDCQMQLADPADPGLLISCRTIYRATHHGVTGSRGTEEPGSRAASDDIWPARPLGRREDLAEYLLRRPSLLGRPGTIPIQTLLMHRSVVERHPFLTEPDHEDWGWLLELCRGPGIRIEFCWRPLIVYNVDTTDSSRSRRTNWQESLAWADAHREAIGHRALASFLATKVALKARRAGDWKGLRRIAGRVWQAHPGPLELLFLAGAFLLPVGTLRAAWRRSLKVS